MIDPYNGRQRRPVCGDIVGIDVRGDVVGHKSSKGSRCPGEGQRPVTVEPSS